MVCDGHQGAGAANHCVEHMPGLLGQLLPAHLPDWHDLGCVPTHPQLPCSSVCISPVAYLGAAHNWMAVVEQLSHGTIAVVAAVLSRQLLLLLFLYRQLLLSLSLSSSSSLSSGLNYVMCQLPNSERTVSCSCISHLTGTCLLFDFHCCCCTASQGCAAVRREGPSSH
jgi:hypothetical protein